MKHLHPMFGWILSDALGIEEKQEPKQDDKKKEQKDEAHRQENL